MPNQTQFFISVPIRLTIANCIQYNIKLESSRSIRGIFETLEIK